MELLRAVGCVIIIIVYSIIIYVDMGTHGWMDR